MEIFQNFLHTKIDKFSSMTNEKLHIPEATE